MLAAAVTKNLKLGTGICLIIERDTIVTAKEVASLDRLSGGRFLLGIGGGWNVEEMQHHGTDFKTRFQKMGEQVRAMKAIWTKDVAEFHGEHVNFESLWCWPKPAQQPHPPVLLGGESSRTLQRVVDYCEGWFPRSRHPELVTKGMMELKEHAAKAGRDMQTISVSVFGAPGDQKLLDTYRDVGVTRVILRLPSERHDAILPLLDQYATFLR
jgi:probable F420-dependent oxidoreductase